jgi:hypothetical protein
MPEITPISNYAIQLPNQISEKRAENRDNTDKSTVGKIRSDGGNETTAKKKTDQKKENAIKELQRTDSRVRAHEAAHQAAGGGLVKGSASFTYKIGPDGKQYAVGGEVKIDMSEIPDDPRATIKKMQQVIRAALAPVDPSGQDRSVASAASNIENKAAAELQKNTDGQNPQSKNLSVNYLQIYKNAGQSSQTGQIFDMKSQN